MGFFFFVLVCFVCVAFMFLIGEACIKILSRLFKQADETVASFGWKGIAHVIVLNGMTIPQRPSDGRWSVPKGELVLGIRLFNIHPGMLPLIAFEGPPACRTFSLEYNEQAGCLDILFLSAVDPHDHEIVVDLFVSPLLGTGCVAKIVGEVPSKKRCIGD